MRKYSDFYFGHCLNTTQLFLTFPLKKLRFKFRDLVEDPDIKELQRRQLCANIFRESVKLVINDIVDNDAQFLLPGELYKSYLKMKVFEKKDFLKVRSKYSKFSNIDPYASNFRGYQIYLFMKKGERTIEKPIYVSHTIRDKIVEYTNNGKQYTA